MSTPEMPLPDESSASFYDVTNFVLEVVHGEDAAHTSLMLDKWKQVSAIPELRAYISRRSHELAPDDLKRRGEIIRDFLGVLAVNDEVEITQKLEQAFNEEIGFAEPADALATAAIAENISNSEPIEKSSRFFRRRKSEREIQPAVRGARLGTAAFVYLSLFRSKRPD